jgi:Fe-S cluster biogenesis protein NfuA
MTTGRPFPPGTPSVSLPDLDQARAVAAAVQVFKRATSLGGVESLIEHRQSTEGPSSPVPEDLLRLSIGLESVDDLRADLEAALEQATRTGAARHPMLEGPSRGLSPSSDNIHTAAAALLEQSVVPSVIARGGALRLLAVKDGVATLEVSGSPGAVLPLTTRIQALLCAALPEVTEVRVVSPAGGPAPEGPPDGVEERLQRVLDEEVNPAVAGHGGRVVLAGVVAGRAHVRLEGRCQGCSLAEVTVRQGIERLCRARLPEIVAVLDVTDHSAGTDPFYTSAKR